MIIIFNTILDIVEPCWHIVENQIDIQWVPQLFERQEFFHANKSCNIECCGNKMNQIVQNMILSRLELKLSLL